MKKVQLSRSVEEIVEVADACKHFLMEKGFTVFCDINHQHNAAQVEMIMPAARTLIFGKPEAGTKLMLKDIHASFDLPLRVAIVENEGKILLLHQRARDFSSMYALDESHPVLQAIDSLFGMMADELNARE